MANQADAMTDCLHGLRVIDLTRNLPGPLPRDCLQIWVQKSLK